MLDIGFEFNCKSEPTAKC